MGRRQQHRTWVLFPISSSAYENPPELGFCRVMMDYVKMEAEYNCSKEVRLRLILKPQGTGFYFCTKLVFCLLRCSTS